MGKCRTFLIYDEDFPEFKVLGYYTIAIQAFKIPPDYSNRAITKLDGLSAKKNGEILTELPAILIGQLGKNDEFEKNITGHRIMEFCLNTVFDGQALLGGRLVILECKDVPYLFDFYQKYGFDKLEKDYKQESLKTFIRILKEDELI